MLITNSQGQFQDTNDPSFLGERFFWRTVDVAGRKVRIVLELDTDENGNFIFVISAWRRIDED